MITQAVAWASLGLGLVSYGTATDGVTLFFLKKTDDFFSHRPLESDDLYFAKKYVDAIEQNALSQRVSGLSGGGSERNQRRVDGSST